MAEETDKHVPKTQSLAYLADQGKVTGYQVPSQSQHVSKNPSDLQHVAEAQIVSTNKDNYVPTTEEAIQLQSGPAKKYIDNPDDPQPEATKPAVPLSNFAHANLNAANATDTAPDTYDAFQPSTNAQEQQNYEAFFGGDDAKQSQQQTTSTTDDIFGGMESTQQNGNDQIPEIEDNNEQNQDQGDEKEEKQTFLSVWQEQHREHLAKKAKEERETQEKMIATAKQELEAFNDKRRLRIEQQRKDAQSKESDLKDDYNAVFKNGTIWQQVAKLVDLKTKRKDRERFRDLLIALKSEQ